ncbi:MAG: HNH endonuclease signature motif containing protein [Pirellulales bacterium]
MDATLRDFVRARANDCCEYCRLPRTAQLMPFHVEHIVAKQHGGAYVVENLAWSCDRSNAYKVPNLSGVDPISGDIVALYHPRRDEWHRHFMLQDARIEGRTAIGRATVRLLQMNARRRVDVHGELIEEGKFNLGG